MPAISVDLPEPVAPADDHHALARPVSVEDALFDELLLERRRHVGDRPQHDVAAVAPRGARRRCVEAEAQPRRAVERDRVGGVEVVAALQPRHAVGAVEMVDDLAELELVERRCRVTRWLRP